jgi:endoglycosylceramidase
VCLLDNVIQVTWGMIFGGNVTGSGFEHVPGGAGWENASAYAYHYYCMSWLPGWETEPLPRKVLCDAAIAPSVFRAVGEDEMSTGSAGRR